MDTRNDSGLGFVTPRLAQLSPADEYDSGKPLHYMPAAVFFNVWPVCSLFWTVRESAAWPSA